jgi:hypothetical protein
MFYVLEPEVAGGLGESSQIDTTTHPPTVTQLEYEFEGWLGDDLLETFPCFIVTERLRDALQQAHVTGASFDDVTVTTSETFRELYPNRVLPRFFWMKVDGQAGVDGVGIGADHRLVVSDEVLAILRQHQLQQCDVEPYSG